MALTEICQTYHFCWHNPPPHLFVLLKTRLKGQIQRKRKTAWPCPRSSRNYWRQRYTQHLGYTFIQSDSGHCTSNHVYNWATGKTTDLYTVIIRISVDDKVLLRIIIRSNIYHCSSYQCQHVFLSDFWFLKNTFNVPLNCCHILYMDWLCLCTW